MSLNLEKQLLFYASYHHDPINIGIHVLCVPLIMMTFFLMGTATPSIELPNTLSIPYLPLNITSVVATIYSSLYILMEPVAGSALGLLILAWTAYSNYLTTIYGWNAVQWSIAVNIVSWIAQFIGHGVFEGRAPALLDNLVQALFLAPFFVWLEILFKLGYRPELKSRIDLAVEKEISALNETKKNKDKTTNGHANGSTKKTS